MTRQNSLTRRALLQSAGLATLWPLQAACRSGSAPAVVASRPTDLRIVEVQHELEEHAYRTP